MSPLSVASGSKASRTPFADPEEDVAARLPADDLQAQHVPVERLGGVQVVHVDRRSFDDALDFAHVPRIP